MQPLHLETALGRDAEQVAGQPWGAVEVVAAQLSDAASVEVVLDARPQYPLEGDQTEEGKRRQDDETERREGRPEPRGAGDQAKGDQAARHRAQEHVGATGGLGDRGGARTLQGEMLGGHHADFGRPKLSVGVLRLLSSWPLLLPGRQIRVEEGGDLVGHRL